MQQESHDVYISYTRKYQSAAETLARKLQEEKISVWLDIWEIKPGASALDEAQAALRQSKCMVVLLGAERLSAEQEKELRSAISSANLKIIAVLLPGTTEDSIPAYLRSYPMIDFRAGLDNPDAAYQLVSEIHGEPILPEAPSEDEDANFEQVARKRPTRKVRPTERAEILSSPAAIIRYGVQIEVAQTLRGWRLDIDGLVISAAYKLDRPGGTFYRSLINNLDRTTRKILAEKLLASFSDPQNNPVSNISPYLVKLDEPWASKVMPFSPSKEKYVIITTITSPDGTRETSNIPPMMEAIIARAREAGISHLAMPIIGTGQEEESLSSDEAKIERAKLMLHALLKMSDFGSLRKITVLTLLPEVVEMAKREFNLYTNNFPQKLANDKPGEDALGIETEVNALADAIMLQDVEAPMAIGILGGWGSGKSTVMGLMKKRISQIRTLPQLNGWQQGTNPSPIYVGHIYVICFNAWSYAKSNLWSSLMQTIFAELNRQLTLEQIFSGHNKAQMLEGGKEFEKLYDEEYKLEEKYSKVEKNIELLKNSKLWQILRAYKSKKLSELQETEKEILEAKNKREEIAIEQLEADTLVLQANARQLATATLKHKIRTIAQGALLAAISAEINRKANQSGATDGHARSNAGKEKDTKPQDANKAESKELTINNVEDAFKTLRSIKTTILAVLAEGKKNIVITVLIIIFLLLALFGIPLISNLVASFFKINPISKLIAQLAALFAAVAPLIKVAGEWRERVNALYKEYQTALETERNNLENQRETFKAKRKADEENEIARAVAAIEIKDKDSPDYLKEKKNTLKKLAEAKNLTAQEALIELLEKKADETRREAGPTACYMSLSDFIHSRLDEGLYEKQLGLMHRVKLDLDELTQGLLVNQWDGQSETETKQTLFPRGKPRVVLFIDDLDRCPPPRVVEVLEAVQLLLSTKLFVVVLGLDTRYVTRALEKEYKEILQHEGDPSGMDYIEKIIQIPYRVRPIEESGLLKYLRVQMDISSEAAIKTVETTRQPESSPTEPQTTQRVETTAISEEGTVTNKDADSNRVEEKPPVQELPPEVIKFKPEDYDDLAACCSIIDLTPRSVKRLVNVLKLIKIFWFRRMEGDRPRPVKRTVIMMLALAASYPEVMREAFDQLGGLFRDETIAQTTTVAELLRDVSLHESLSGQSEKYLRDLQSIARREFGAITLKEMGLTTLNLVRSFSFVGDPSDKGGNTATERTAKVAEELA